MNPSPKSPKASMLLEIQVIFNFYLYKLNFYKIAQNILFLKVIYRKSITGMLKTQSSLLNMYTSRSMLLKFPSPVNQHL